MSESSSFEHIALANAETNGRGGGGGDHHTTTTTAEGEGEEGEIVVARSRRQHDENDDDGDDVNGSAATASEQQKVWSPSGSNWRDFLYFCGPGWFVSSKCKIIEVVMIEQYDTWCPLRVLKMIESFFHAL
jgi:hypothetical protein